MKNTRGYTLLEMTVAVGLFSLVMLLATGAFLKFISLDRKARYTNDVVNNLNFAVDSMARAIRTGSTYRCAGSSSTPNCWPPSTGGATFTFLDDKGREVTYLVKSDGSIGVCALSIGTACTSTNATSLTDQRIVIQTLAFYVRGVGTTVAHGLPPQQPQVLISIKGYMKPDENSPNIDFSIETMATQRIIEI